MKNCGGYNSNGGEKEKGATARSRRRDGGGTTGIEDDAAVEELLQSAQDEMMLKLSVDSHTTKLPKDSLPSDLRRRFDALKSVPAISINSSSSAAAASSGVSEPTEKDLMARFNALQGKKDGASAAPIAVFPSSDRSSGIVDEEDDEEDEVEKIIRWAKDAARLDPSPASDSDDGDLSE